MYRVKVRVMRLYHTLWYIKLCFCKRRDLVEDCEGVLVSVSFKKSSGITKCKFSSVGLGCVPLDYIVRCGILN